MVVECRIWWSRPSPGAGRFERLLDPVERTRYAAYRNPQERDRFATGRVLARVALAAELRQEPDRVRLHTECNRCRGPHGKPRVVDAPGDVELSISHAGDWVLVGTAHGAALGVDVERIRHCGDLAAPLAGVLADRERAQLHRLPPEERSHGFHVYWTRKEAVLKAVGVGLEACMSNLVVCPPDTPAQVLSWTDAPCGLSRIQLWDLFPGPGYCGALAVLTEDPVHVREQFVEWVRTSPGSPPDWRAVLGCPNVFSCAGRTYL